MAYFQGSAVAGSAGRLAEFSALNRSMTQAEHVLYFKEGVAVADRGASQVPVYESDFSAGVDGWSLTNGATITGNVDGIDGQNDWLQITGGGATNSGAIKSISAIAQGRNAKVKIRVHVAATNVDCNGIVLFLLTAAGGSISNAGRQYLSPGIGATADYIVERKALFSALGQVNVRLSNNDSATPSVTSGDTVYIKFVEVNQIGLTSQLAPESIQLTPGQWLESVNKSHVILPNGARVQEPKTSGVVRGVNTFSASDVGQPLNNVDLPILPSSEVALTLRCKATVEATFNIGDGVDADRYAAGVTIGTDWTPITLLKLSHDGTNRKIVITPTASYSGVVTTAARVDLLA